MHPNQSHNLNYSLKVVKYMVSSYFELNTKEQVIFFKNFSNFGPAQPGPSIFNLAQARPGPKANIDLGPWPGRAKISMAHFRPGPKNFGPNSSLFYSSMFGQ